MITLIILALSITFAGLTLAVFSIGSTVDHTSIGFIYLGNFKEDQYGTVISREVDLWKDDADYRILYQDYSYIIDLNILDLDLDTTLLNIEKNQKNQAYFNLSNDQSIILRDEIETQFTLSLTSTFDMSSFVNDLLDDADNLKTLKVYELEAYLNPDLATTVLDHKTMSSITNTDVDTIISQVTTINIAANERFSLLDQLGDLTLSNEQLSIIASGIQSVTMNTNFNGFIFEQNYTLPSWATSGQNVRILRINQFDLTFFNGFDFNYQITIQKINDTTLEFSLLGYPLITSYETAPVFQVAIPYQTIYIINETIDETTPGVIIIETDTEYTYHLLVQSGVAGYVTFYVRTETRLGELGIQTKLFDEQMLPTPEIYYENIVEK